jgi:acyl-CoA reductase-like NAD-dependent aldehyde dehydrogenase
LAPDYVLCSKTTENRLVPEIIKAWQSFYTNNPINSDSYCHIVNEKHFERVKKLIDTSKVIYGGETDSKHNYISPTIMYVEDLFFFLIYSFCLLGQMSMEMIK